MKFAEASLKLNVRDFGPIAKADLDLRPLTVFVGPSNTGKSYLAILIYALHKHFSSVGGWMSSEYLFRSRLSHSHRKNYQLSRSNAEALKELAKCISAEGKGSRSIKEGFRAHLKMPLSKRGR